MNLLFLCTGNACRSQMAEGYAHLFGEDSFKCKSAGLSPQGIHPLAIVVMKEEGIDISSQESTLLTRELIEWADLLITLCGDADGSCPALPPGREKRHWPFEDPAKATGHHEEVLEKFRLIRDGIKKQVIRLADEFKSHQENVP